ncbi:MAG: 3-methyladenine DNA glycosylase [Kiritimatiellae bacterium]|nr:3-methyladenine DNA glycosylase [Kiritimatiellia bacterium]MDW8459185.1 3-methyladenine DNA glycosylase [Verrucomicrobiota bacterium]
MMTFKPAPTDGTFYRLSEAEWTARRAAHEERLRPVVEPHLARQSRHESHPVIDFLFQYYGYRASALLRWSPGLGVILEGDRAREFLRDPRYEERDGGVALRSPRFSPTRLEGIRWILNLLETTASRPPRFGCFGMHEWAMVYRASSRRHSGVPLRMGDDELAKFVEVQRIACSHYDAFRFFTPAARPLNRLQPSAQNRIELEQRGCLHTNMDLYKWAMKIWPWVESELVGDAFLLALEIRELDMRASPYDLSRYGYAPVRIETPEGRLEYSRLQQHLAEKAVPVRLRLIDAYCKVLNSTTPNVEYAGSCCGESLSGTA